MATQTAPTRVVGGREIPPPGRWTIDLSHSSIELVARHMMISKVRGRFRQFSGIMEIAEAPEQSWVEVVVDAASIDTGDEQRDAHLRSPDFLDVDRWPHIVFRSTSVSPAPNDRWTVTGELTLRDVTRTVSLDVEFCGATTDPWGKLRAGFLASGEINRDEFDVTWNQVLESGGFLVGKGVKLEADIEAVLQSGDGTPPPED
jgi:polyisoprenoid-binding protein YceI